MSSIPNICSIKECAKIAPPGRRSWCLMHYTRWRSHGDPLVTKYDRSVRDVTKIPEYKVWQDMKYRCESNVASGYERYGGRGIIVSELWNKSFQTFYKDMGKRPSDSHSLERINNDGNYEPGNCRWATRQEQASNRRSNRFFTMDGDTKTLKQWSDFYDCKYKTVHARIQAGYSIERALGLDI